MSQKRFQVALSFPGEHREYVLQVAELLGETLGRDVILYDAWYKAEFTRPDLDVYLTELYHKQSELLVPFLCTGYNEKDWCGLEWRAIKDLLKQKQYGNIMPMRFDDADIPGLYGTDGYLDLQTHTPKEVADLILQRLELMGISPPNDGGADTPQKHIQIDRLPTVAGEFFGREAELELLNEALRHKSQIPSVSPSSKGSALQQSTVEIEGSPTLQNGEQGGFSPRVIQFIASGGTGKTKLLRHWLNQLQDAIGNYIIWSFYSQGTSDSKQVSATPLFTEAFKAFGVDYEQFNTDEDRADALADLLIEHQCLLVLDGLEPLQHGGTGFDGQLKDRAMKRLLQKLAQGHSSLCIITTRINVHELKDRSHVISHPLDNLSTGDGVELLRSWGVQGADKDMQIAVEEVEGHALTLHLLGNAITTYLDSDIRKRDTLDELVDDYAAQGRHAFKVMQAYQHWLRDENGESTAELQLLYLLGLFDHPIEIAVLQVLWEQQIVGLTAGIPARAWKIALRALQDKHRLLSQHGERPDLLDCHPLIREYFGRQLEQYQPEVWQQAHEALYHYYKALPEKELPDTVEEMQPLFHAVAHGCAAGLHQQALDEVYWPLIRREDDAYIIKKLGALSSDLAVVANFFSQPWRKPVAGLTEDWQAVVFNWAGFRLRSLGRLREAVEPLEAGMEMSAKQEDWEGAAIDAGSLSELQLTLGRVTSAVISGEHNVVYAEQSGKIFQRMTSRVRRADVLHNVGQADKALALFGEAERLQQEYQSDFPQLYSVRGFRYCNLLLTQGSTAEVQERAKQTLEWAKQYLGPLDIALDKLTLGSAHHAQGDLPQAHAWLEQAVAGLHKAGYQDYLPYGLLARAAIYRDLDKFDIAQQDLAEVWEIAEASEMRLFMVDYHLEMARLLLASGGEGNVQYHVTEADRLIHKTGYHRRDPELVTLKQQVGH